MTDLEPTRSRSRAISLSILFVVALLSSCASRGSGPAPGAHEPEASRDEGQLEVLYPRIREEGSNLVLSLTVRNSYEVSIDGVRILYRVLTSRATDGLEIARTQQEFPTQLAKGDVAVVEITLPPEARGKSAGATIWAYAARRGGQPIPWPPLWKTGEAPDPSIE